MGLDTQPQGARPVQQLANANKEMTENKEIKEKITNNRKEYKEP